MKLRLIIASVGLVSLTVSVPIFIHSHGSPTLKSILYGKRINDCKGSTFHDQYSDGSPLVSDCKQLAENINGSGSWTLPGFKIQRALATYGTCAFGAASLVIGIHVGNEDIRDIIESSVLQFQKNEKVGAKGTMSCGEYDVHWGLYHT